MFTADGYRRFIVLAICSAKSSGSFLSIGGLSFACWLSCMTQKNKSGSLAVIPLTNAVYP